jgi:hypothetical protein
MKKEYILGNTVIIILCAALTFFTIRLLFGNPIAKFQHRNDPAPIATMTPTHVQLRDATYQEFMDFMFSDKTNENKWVKDVYMCVQFAMDIVNNAHALGYNAEIVSVTFADGGPGHEIVRMPTSDQGMVYFEPQDDEQYYDPLKIHALCLSQDVNPNNCVQGDGSNHGIILGGIYKGNCNYMSSACIANDPLTP